MSDQHARHITGCYGNDTIRTPHIDSIAERGTRFNAAYTPCPICVPARASFATGLYTHQNEYWDNAHPYDGAVRGWGHELIERGHRVESIGKLHYRDDEDKDGFSVHHIPLNVVAGKGDPQSSLREDIPVRMGNHAAIAGAGAGNSSYLKYDEQISDTACQWIKDTAASDDETPWVLFVSFVCPHPPYTSRPDYFEYYLNKDLPFPHAGAQSEWPRTPALAELRRVLETDTPFSAQETKRISAAYYGIVNSMDDRVGEVLSALEKAGLSKTTRVIYTTDHGESLGQRGLYGKFTMYEDAAAIPLVMSGPDIPIRHNVDTPVSLVDFYPTLIEMVTGSHAQEKRDGQSLIPLLVKESPDRSIISEYHAVGSENAWYLIRKRNFKLIHYLDSPPELYDLNADPLEERNLAGEAGFITVLDEMNVELRRYLDPVEVDARAKKAQADLIQRYGGRDAVLNQGTFINSPAPGEGAAFVKETKKKAGQASCLAKMKHPRSRHGANAGSTL